MDLVVPCSFLCSDSLQHWWPEEMQRFSFVTLGTQPQMPVVVSRTVTYPEEGWRQFSTNPTPHFQLTMLLGMVLAKVGTWIGTHLNQTTAGMEKVDKSVTEVNLLSVGFCLLGMHYAVYITFLWDEVPLDGRMSDSRFFLLRYPVKNEGKIFQTTPWHLNISWSNQDNVDQRPQLRCFRLEETAAMIIISVFLLEYASAS